jgi:NAD(P)-dependent dehydrogenase (short-subunit alcohol dehydrogenase family)
MGKMDDFATVKHQNLYPAIDPTNIRLPSPFVVCIVGASSGIGEHIAYAYARAGASGIVIASRQTDELQRVAAEIHTINAHTEVEVVSCDISSASSVESLAASVQTRFGGRLDVVVPNAGYAGPVTLRVTEGAPEWFQQNFDVNTIGTYNVAHYFIPLLLASHAGSAKAFLCIGSFAAGILNGPIANTGYCLSKFAQTRFIEYLGEQFAGVGLLASVIHPGAVSTPMAENNTPQVFLPCKL